MLGVTPPLTVVNEGLGWDPLLKMVHNPGGHCYWEGATQSNYMTYLNNAL